MPKQKQKQKEIRLDKPYVKHSKAGDDDTKVWFYEELEGEILAYAQYCVRKSNCLKGDPIHKAHLKRIGNSLHNLKTTSSLAFGNYEDLYKYE